MTSDIDGDDASVGLAGGDRFQQQVGRSGPVHELDIKIVFGEKPPLVGNRHGDVAQRGRHPGKRNLTRRPAQRGHIRGQRPQRGDSQPRR